MSITTSQIISQVIQPNGSINVHERHTDHTGKTYDIQYNAPQGSNITAIINARAVIIENKLKENDLYRAIFIEPWDYTLVHATNADLAPFVRTLYKESIQDQTAIIGMRLIEWVTNRRFTETQIRNAFGLTLSRWNTLKAKIQVLIDDFNAIQGAKGE